MQFVRKLIALIGSVFAGRREPASKRSLLGMYFNESNSGGRRKTNRDRA